MCWLCHQKKKIEFEYTDDTTDENLIIKTDKQFYSGITKAKVFFNVTNTSDKQDDFHLQAHFPRTKGEVLSLKKWTKNVPKEVEKPEYASVAHYCDAGWDVVTDEDLEPVSIETPAVETTTTASTTGSIGTTSEEFGRGGTLEDGSEAFETEEEAPESSSEGEEDSIEEEETPTENVVEETAEEATEVVDEEDVIDSESEESDEEEETEQENTSEETTASSTEERDDVNDDNATTTNDTATGTESVTEFSRDELRAFIEDTAKDILDDTEEKTNRASSTEELLALGERFYCEPLDEYRVCDEMNEEGTNCIDNHSRIGMEKIVDYRDEWMPVALQDGEAIVDQSAFTKLSRLFGGALPRKEVPESFDVKDSTDELHRIEPGQTLYFEMEINYPVNSDGEFWLEAIGKKGDVWFARPMVG